MKQRVISTQEYNDFRQFLADVSGIVLGDNKHYLVGSRLNRLMEEHELDSYQQLLERILSSQNLGLREKVIDAMTTNETMWFRDIYPFELLNNELFPTFAKQKKASIRIWSAACSSGQEPYSMSIIANEFITNNSSVFPAGVEIVGTDISSEMLKCSKLGVYDSNAMHRGLSEDRRSKYFKEVPGGWQVNETIRSRVNFRALNLQASFSGLGKFDVIFCRNVLIYFSSEFKTDILTRMSQVLNPGGYLMLGSSETPTRYTPLYQMVRASQGVIYQLASTNQ